MGYMSVKETNGKSLSFEEFCKKYGHGHGKAWIKEKIAYHQNKILHIIKPIEIHTSCDDIRLWR